MIVKNQSKICEIFNYFFTSISSSSKSNLSEVIDFTDSHFSSRTFSSSCVELKFSFTNSNEIMQLLNEIKSSSGPGISGIPAKILKFSLKKLHTVLAYLFNCCRLECDIRKEWKLAVVTPLYKNKGAPDDINNYRRISVLPPIAKLFEKLISKQFTKYLND